MDYPVYKYALCVSLTLMIFFACNFIFGRLPTKETFKVFRKSRILMGSALLVLSANYSIHFFFTPRQSDVYLTIFLNLSTFFLAIWLICGSLLLLIDHACLTRRRIVLNLVAWIIYSLLFWFIGSSLEFGRQQLIALMAMSAVFISYCICKAIRVLKAFHRIRRSLDGYYADNHYAYVRWMSVVTHWSVVFGTLQGILAFMPSRYVYLLIIAAIPFYIYIYISFRDYLLFYEEVERVASGDENTSDSDNEKPSSQQEQLISEHLEQWIAQRGYTASGLTIADLARDAGTNRTYVSAYINSRYGMSFREWVNSLRLDYARQLLLERPDMTIADVAQQAGYLSLSYFTKTFTLTEGNTPGRWRRENC